jgi:hypothetical protein
VISIEHTVRDWVKGEAEDLEPPKSPSATSIITEIIINAYSKWGKLQEASTIGLPCGCQTTQERCI